MVLCQYQHQLFKEVSSHSILVIKTTKIIRVSSFHQFIVVGTMFSHDDFSCVMPFFPTSPSKNILQNIFVFCQRPRFILIQFHCLSFTNFCLVFFSSLSEDKVWTTVYHDLQMQTSVGGNSLEKLSVLQLNYSATMDQISAITSSAEYCEQFISYSCKMSRLLNTPGRLRMGYQLNTVLNNFIWTIQQELLLELSIQWTYFLVLLH